MTILIMLHNPLKNGNIVAGGTPAYQAGEDACAPQLDFESTTKPHSHGLGHGHGHGFSDSCQCSVWVGMVVFVF